MQNSTTILGIIEMRLKGISYDDCRNRYGVGNSTVNLIMTRYLEKGIPLEVLKQMPAECVRRSETTAGPLKSDTLTAQILHPFRRSDSWGCERGDRLVCRSPRRLA